MKGTLEELIKALRPLGDFKRIRNQLKFNCPRCEDELGMLHNKFNLEVNYKKGAFHCWACGQHGTLYGIIKKYGYKEYLGLFKTEKLDEFDFKKDEIRKEIELPRYLKSVLNVEEAKEYLYSRGITEKIIIQRNIGYCYGGVYNGYIVFPSFNLEGELTAILYHDYKNKQYRQKKGNNFICFYESFIDKHSLIILVEGIYDSYSLPNSFPLLGLSLSEELLNFLTGTNILLALDNDIDKKVYSQIEKKLSQVCNVKKLPYPKEYKDLNEMFCKNKKVFIDLFKRYYI